MLILNSASDVNAFPGTFFILLFSPTTVSNVLTFDVSARQDILML